MNTAGSKPPEAVVGSLFLPREPTRHHLISVADDLPTVLTGHTGPVEGLVELADGRLDTWSANEAIVWSHPDNSPDAEINGTLLPLSSQAALVSATGVYLASAFGPLLAFDLPGC